jgi:hypothetical protein
MSDNALGNAPTDTQDQYHRTDPGPAESAREAATIMGISETSGSDAATQTTGAMPDFGATPSAGDSSGTASMGSAPSGTNGSSAATHVGLAAPIVDQARQQAQKVIEHTQRSAGEAIDQAKQKTTSWVETQLDSAADNLNSLASAMRDTGAQFRTNDPAHMGQIAEVTTGVADAVENVSTRLRDATVDDILTETNTFARHQPALFLGGALAVGFLLARFLKSTSASANAGGGSGYAPSTDRLLPVPLDQGPRRGV